jgi:Tol biopolymer transport system component
MSPDGSNEVQVTNNSNLYSSVSYSPDGTKFVVTGRFSSNRTQVYVINIDGSNAVKLTDESDCCAVNNPHWSPDGSKIVLSIRRNSTNNLYTVTPDGSGTPIRISNSGSDESQPFWGVVVE